MTEVASPTGVPAYARGYERFPGRIGRTTAESTRAWPREKRAREGAPNIVVVLIDDMGYSDIGPFGSEIPTPTLDRLAAEGVVLTNYHTTPVCSPARAALLTGINPHRAGFASVANSDPGFPGLRLELDEDVATLPEVLRHHGYATFGVGKWHLTRDALMNAAADKRTWPIQRGFDSYYGSLEGLNSFFHPNQIVRDNTPVVVDERPDDYYLTDDYTDEAIRQIRSLRASDSRKPFFLYYAHTAMHGPLGAKPEDIERHRGRYALGWDEVRRRRFARQKELGIVPAHARLPERNTEFGLDVSAWADLPDELRDRYAAYQEVYSAMVDSVDQSLGRIVALLDELGEKDNTLIVFTSDNGGTAEGGAEGTRSYFSRFVHLSGLPQDWEPDVNRDPSLIGGPRAMIHYPRGWGMASNTPFRLYKGQTFAGGIRVPFVASWPAGLDAGSGDGSHIRPQFQYVTDVLPTILDLVGLEHPGVRHNLPTKEIDGVSFAPVLRDASHPGTRPEQYSEFGGQRGFYRDGWKLVTLHRPGAPLTDQEWQLFDVAADPTETTNVAAEHPDKVAELAAGWERAAWANTVFPVSSGFGLDGLRRPAEAELSRPVTLRPGTPTLERHRSAALTNLRTFEVLIDVHVGDGDEGVLVSHGDQSGGYVVYVEGGRLRLSYNEYGRVVRVDGGPVSGDVLVRLRLEPRERFRADVSLAVDGVEVASETGLWLLTGMAPFSGIDVGITRGGPVDWELYERRRSFAYGGRLRSVRYEPGEPAPYDPALIEELNADTAAFYD